MKSDFIQFFKECWGDIALDSAIFFIVIHAFHLGIWQTCAFFLLFVRLQSRVITELLGIHSYTKSMFKPVIKTEVIVEGIKRDVRSIKNYLFENEKPD